MTRGGGLRLPRTTFRAYHHRAVRHPISNQILLGILAVAAASVLWSTLGIFGKLFQQAGVSPLQAAALRALFAFLSLAATRPLWVRWFPPRKAMGADFKSIPIAFWRKIPFLALYGIVSLTGMYAFYFLAVARTSVSMAVILLYTAPTLVLVLALLLGLERFRPQRLVGILLAFAGIALLGSASLGSGDMWGFLPLDHGFRRPRLPPHLADRPGRDVADPLYPLDSLLGHPDGPRPLGALLRPLPLGAAAHPSLPGLGELHLGTAAWGHLGSALLRRHLGSSAVAGRSPGGGLSGGRLLAGSPTDRFLDASPRRPV
ncbi:MAG: DMT family transporter [Coprothermobacterota bacterium]|nr:DMT family transporter [Coprothermobacterota bacterium]